MSASAFNPPKACLPGPTAAVRRAGRGRTAGVVPAILAVVGVLSGVLPGAGAGTPFEALAEPRTSQTVFAAQGTDRTGAWTPADCRALGPWYTDLAGHWAESYIYVLWWEGVTTRPLASRGTPPEAEGGWSCRGPYGPDASAGQVVFGTMLLRVFPGPPFPPPPAAYELAGRPASWAGSDSAGLVPLAAAAPNGVAGKVDPGLTRLEAVTALIQALDLGDFAAALNPTKVETYLRQFRDSTAVAPDHRREMAVAVLLGIIRGYPDGTLQPRRQMTRAEAATVLYRSCLFLTRAAPNPFSPDGDGAEDSTVITMGSLLNRNARDWNLFILDGSGRTLRHLRPPGAGPVPPASVVWRGETDSGLILTPGTYYCQGWLRDRDGRLFWSTPEPIVLEAKSLTGFVRPTFVLPGETVTLTAAAAGGPSRVTAALDLFPDAGPLPLARVGSGSRLWEAAFTVPIGTPPGDCTVSFSAFYPKATRSAAAAFRVGRFAVRAGLQPNPVQAGRRVEVTAWPNLHPDSCSATFQLPGGAIVISLRPLKRTGQEAWSGDLLLDPAVPPGTYPVAVEATLGQARARVQLLLNVTRPDGALTFILTD